MDKLILYSRSKLLLISDETDGTWRLPFAEEFPAFCFGISSSPEEIFRLQGYIAVPLPEGFNPSGRMRIEGLREAWELLSPDDYRAAVKGAELLNWSAETRFCPTCGSRLHRATEISRKCSSCNRELFPEVWPAIVVLVIKEDESGDPDKETALLVHARTLSRPTVQTLVAGFVETGESLEECVAREVKEETSLDIEEIKYVGSQSWPFPHQLMLGFTARYKGGEMVFADGELTSGGFFTRDSLPDLPTMPSLSRKIIDRWAKQK